MSWLELRNDDVIFEPGWRFSESAWVPTKKENGSRWPYWSLINNVCDGDLIFHLKKQDGERYFTGYSYAQGDGYITSGIPTLQEHAWKYSNEFYKVDLRDYTELLPHISLASFFKDHDNVLRTYFEANRLSETRKKLLFFVIQKNRLQCQNGAYFSEFDNELSQLLIGDFETKQQTFNNVNEQTNAGTALGTLRRRIGQEQFSKNVKDNFQHKCCYPGCKVEGENFLIAGHIARWADNHELRGKTANGLSLCLMHDKAFEKGFFTIDKELQIRIVPDKIGKRTWLFEFLKVGDGLPIKECGIKPSETAILEHWHRIKYVD